MPQVSVIIPTYNRARYLTRALESVFVQEYRDVEIIVVDDGSRDNTRSVLAPYRHRITYLYQENAGVSAARNAGIGAAQGDWIAFLDSDDEWRKGYLAAQMASVELYPQAVAHVANSVFICLGGGETVDHFRELGVLKLFGEEERILLDTPFRAIVGSSHWFLQPIIMRRETLLAAGLFDTSLSIAEDMDVVARLALRGPFTLNRRPLVEIYRREEETDNLSAQYMNRGIYSRKAFGRVFTSLMAQPQLTLLDRAVLARTLGCLWRALGNIYLKKGDLRQARRYYLKSLAVYPSPKGVVKCLAAFLPQGIALMVIRKKVDVVPGDEGELP